MAKLNREQKRSYREHCKARANTALLLVETPAPAEPTISELRALQAIACANAQAWQEECSRLTDLITQLEPP